jgi:uncharacterized protein (TIGR02679 family)
VVIPKSLTAPDLAPVWQLVRDRLDTRGPQWRGRIRPPSLSSRGTHLLESLLGGTARFIDLTALESALLELHVADDLADSLRRLGFPLSADALQRRNRRQHTRDVRDRAGEATATWPEQWSGDWFRATWKAGTFRSMNETQAVALVNNVRRLLDVNIVDQWSRTQLAAMVLGDAHALDRGSRLEAAAARALCFALGLDFDATERLAIWDAIGAPVDVVSMPVMTWALPLRESPTAQMASAAIEAGVPLYLNTAALRRHPIVVDPNTDVLLVENPRVIEAAMERGSTQAMICGNGNPTLAVRLLIDRLQQSGATVRCHGDFDAAGLAIVGRLVASKCIPWKMGADDYEAAINSAQADGVVLPTETRTTPHTPWDPLLATVFETHRSIVHEERLIDTLLL